MNIRQIEIFKAVMENGTVTQAASNLNISQPSVSKHLKLLEHTLGFALFERSGNKLIATLEGHALFDQVGRVYTGLSFLNSFADDLRNNQHGELSIAAMPLIAQKWLPRCIAEFIAMQRKVSFSLPVRSTDWIAPAVAARRVHFGIGLKPSETSFGVKITSLMKLPFVCVMPKTHPLAEHKAVQLHSIRGHGLISLHSFEGQPLIFETLARDFKSGERRTIETFAANVACELVQQGAGIALVDLLTARDSLGDTLVFRPFLPRTNMEICIMTPEHWPLSRLATELMHEIIQKARETENALTKLIPS